MHMTLPCYRMLAKTAKTIIGMIFVSAATEDIQLQYNELKHNSYNTSPSTCSVSHHNLQPSLSYHQPKRITSIQLNADKMTPRSALET